MCLITEAERVPLLFLFRFYFQSIYHSVVRVCRSVDIPFIFIPPFFSEQLQFSSLRFVQASFSIIRLHVGIRTTALCTQTSREVAPIANTANAGQLVGNCFLDRFVLTQVNRRLESELENSACLDRCMHARDCVQAHTCSLAEPRLLNPQGQHAYIVLCPDPC